MSKYLFTHSLIFLTFLVSAFLIMASDTAERDLGDKFVIFPPKHVLISSFQYVGLDYLVSQTSIVDIVDERLVLEGVVIAVKTELDKYYEEFKQCHENSPCKLTTARSVINAFKPKIFEILLQADPAALEKLRKAHFDSDYPR